MILIFQKWICMGIGGENTKRMTPSFLETGYTSDTGGGILTSQKRILKTEIDGELGRENLGRENDCFGWRKKNSVVRKTLIN